MMFPYPHQQPIAHAQGGQPAATVSVFPQFPDQHDNATQPQPRGRSLTVSGEEERRSRPSSIAAVAAVAHASGLINQAQTADDLMPPDQDELYEVLVLPESDENERFGVVVNPITPSRFQYQSQFVINMEDLNQVNFHPPGAVFALNETTTGPMSSYANVSPINQLPQHGQYSGGVNMRGINYSTEVTLVAGPEYVPVGDAGTLSGAALKGGYYQSSQQHRMQQEQGNQIYQQSEGQYGFYQPNESIYQQQNESIYQPQPQQNNYQQRFQHFQQRQHEEQKTPQYQYNGDLFTQGEGEVQQGQQNQGNSLQQLQQIDQHFQQRNGQQQIISEQHTQQHQTNPKYQQQQYGQQYQHSNQQNQQCSAQQQQQYHAQQPLPQQPQENYRFGQGVFQQIQQNQQANLHQLQQINQKMQQNVQQQQGNRKFQDSKPQIQEGAFQPGQRTPGKPSDPESQGPATAPTSATRVTGVLPYKKQESQLLSGQGGRVVSGITRLPSTQHPTTNESAKGGVHFQKQKSSVLSSLAGGTTKVGGITVPFKGQDSQAVSRQHGTVSRVEPLSSIRLGEQGLRSHLSQSRQQLAGDAGLYVQMSSFANPLQIDENEAWKLHSIAAAATDANVFQRSFSSFYVSHGYCHLPALILDMLSSPSG
eukprot:GHVN01058773.1.p1 GENE.GHVN01058773.1~~GHVN01058773.1.p1  ORF type:complete len:648 (+),score=85.66 GHVN01058773.1:547-2490(+)